MMKIPVSQLASLRNEYNQIWSKKFSIITLLYAGSRYWTLICLAYLSKLAFHHSKSRIVLPLHYSLKESPSYANLV